MEGIYIPHFLEYENIYSQQKKSYQSYMNRVTVHKRDFAFMFLYVRVHTYVLLPLSLFICIF